MKSAKLFFACPQQINIKGQEYCVDRAEPLLANAVSHRINPDKRLIYCAGLNFPLQLQRVHPVTVTIVMTVKTGLLTPIKLSR